MTARGAHLHQLTTVELGALLAAGPVVALVPIGSTEPHGPHLGLGTDVAISTAACARAVDLLAERGTTAVIAPAVPYGVTECAAGFAGAVSVPGPILTAFVGAVCDGLVAQGFAQVALVNNHLEPDHDAAIRAVAIDRPQVVVACPLTRRWARTLSAEFKSGACHAGRYETSIVLAAEPALVDEAARATLAPVPISLAEQLRAGVTTFVAMGMRDAYAGDPAAATAAEGAEQIERLAEMIVGELSTP
ncbi:MAG: creatininase family protein [Myxococcales bacterium]|nr:creatininase family protein [Myxococcales bacterium]